MITDFYSQSNCNNLDNGKHSGALLLDLKKAFDTVNREILLRKLDKYRMALEEIVINSF